MKLLFEKHKRKCLINGIEMSYDVCTPNVDKDSDIYKNFKFIGIGTITTIDGIDQESDEKYRFYKDVNKQTVDNLKTR